MITNHELWFSSIKKGDKIGEFGPLEKTYVILSSYGKVHFKEI